MLVRPNAYVQRNLAVNITSTSNIKRKCFYEVTMHFDDSANFRRIYNFINLQFFMTPITLPCVSKLCSSRAMIAEIALKAHS